MKMNIITEKKLLDYYSKLTIKRALNNDSCIQIIPSFNVDTNTFFVDKEVVDFVISLQKEFGHSRRTIYPKESTEVKIRDQQSVDFILQLLIQKIDITAIITGILVFFHKRLNSRIKLEITQKSNTHFNHIKFEGRIEDLKELIKETEENNDE